MRLNVEHVTTYHYDPPARGVVQSHRLTPSQCASQSVVDWRVTVSGGVAGGNFRDGAGDRVQAFSVLGPVERVEIRVKGIVETRDTQGILKGHRETIPPIAWLAETALTEPDGALRALAETAEGADALTLAHALSALASDALEYDSEATAHDTTAAEALRLGRGVCQDYAHVLIALARIHDLPARYVSGYLFSDAEGRAVEATHAWAEIWIETLGWVGFDPTNRCCPDPRYIRLASGADAQGAAPIRGIARQVVDEGMEITVAIAAAQQ